MKRIALVFTVLAVVCCTYFFFSRQATTDPELIVEAVKELASGMCQEPEGLNRHLLQQTWFNDSNYTQVAGAFGQHSFSLYQQSATEQLHVEGAYCIEGNTLRVKYFNRRFVPIGINLTEMYISFGAKLVPKGKDSITVKELDQNHMVLLFASDNSEHVLFKKL